MQKTRGFTVSALAVGLFLGTAPASAEGVATVVDKTLTLDGLVTNITSEADLGSVTNVVMQNGGGIAFNETMTLQKTYTIGGDGLNSTGIIDVAAGKTVDVTGAKLAKGAVGHVLVKRGAGTFQSGAVASAASAKTRFIVEAGTFQCTNGDFWGGHTAANTNVTIDVREGAVYDHGSEHGVVGPIELTGAKFLSRNGAPYNNQWADASLNGGVTAHASTTDSYMFFKSWGFLGHNGCTNCVMNVEDGARLIIDGVLTNGFSNGGVPNRLTKSGAGELVLLQHGGWTGGTYLEGGTLTIADAKAIWTGPLVVSGDVTLQVLPGVTFDCPPVFGSGTITKTGAGVANFPSVGAGVTVTTAEAGTTGSPVKDGTLYLSGGVTTVNVPAGETVTVTSLAEAVSGMGPNTDIVKTGAGALVLPTDSSTKYAQLIVQEGHVAVSAESCFGSDEVTVQNGGCLDVTKSFNQARTRITFIGNSGLDIATNVVFGTHSNYFYSAGARVTKTGWGQWKLTTAFREDKQGKIAKGTWVIHEGTLKGGTGDIFGGHSTRHTHTLEIHEDGRFELQSFNTHTPLKNVILRGGELYGFYGQLSSDSQPIESGSKWKGFGLNGPITVLPSLDGRPSRIRAYQSHLVHGNDSLRTVFDVQTGATLEVDTMLQYGWRNTIENPNYKGLVKRGGGTLKLLRPVGTHGTFDIEDGTVVLGPKVHLDDQLKLNVSPRAKFVMEDGAQLVNSTDLASALCATADVWFDASRLNLADGASVSSVPNLGTAGGAFEKFTWTSTNYRIPDLPTFSTAGINGKGALAFNGIQALCLPSYTNKTDHIQVYYVSMWTYWTQGTGSQGGMGKWGGPMSFGNRKMTGDDNNMASVLSYQHGGTTINTLSTYSGTSAAHLNIAGLTENMPYLVSTHRTSTTKDSTVYLNDDTKLQSAKGTHNANNLAVEFLCLGGRTSTAGAAQVRAGSTVPTVGSNDRMYVGRIGEVLAFTRTLTADEEAQILAYLKRKWFNSTVEVSDETKKAIANTLAVEVPADATAHLVANADTTTGGVGTEIAKTGAGTLRLGGAIDGEATVDVVAGGLALKKGALPSQVDIWVDATDAASYTLDANSRVTNLVNKGSAGGAFTLNTRGSSRPVGPTLRTDGINGNAVLQFDGAQALALTSYTNRTDPRSLHIFMAGRRTQWQVNPAEGSNGGGFGKWSGAFSFARTTLAASEEQQPGVCFWSDGSEAKTSIDDGTAKSCVNVASPKTGDAFVFSTHTVGFVQQGAFETNGTDVAKVPRALESGAREALDIDLVQLGGRLEKNGIPQWYGDERFANRMWYTARSANSSPPRCRSRRTRRRSSSPTSARSG